MQNLVILSRREEEQVVRAIEAGLDVQRLRQLFIWSQGQLRGLLPHSIMVCLRLGDNDEVLHVECLNSLPRDAADLQRLCDPVDGLALRLARHCRERGSLSCLIAGAPPLAGPPALVQFRLELDRHQLGNALVQGTERLPGGATFFALFAILGEATPRHAFFLSLMLPYLHMAFLRVIANREGSGSPHSQHTGQHTSQYTGQLTAALTNRSATLTLREIEVLGWVTKGKSNPEIGQILELSALTVKNHLQKIYRKLQVNNRVQALSRCQELKLLAPRGR
ncbi:MAG: helix-turn-helix transcriptional regulator [Microbacteriaceae bacterium]|nr:helix-turn-helix transcriptional regulator [Burkholderiaceae bacterium]